MNPSLGQVAVFDAVVVEETLQFTLADLSRACDTQQSELVALVDEGIVQPIQAPPGNPQDWRFEGAALARARRALRLARELHLAIEATALVVDLLDEIAALKSRLRRAGLD